MRIGLSLGGGGALGYAHIGAIRAFEEAGISINVINGSSMGAIVGGAYALYKDIDHLSAILSEVTRNINVKSFNIFRYSEEAQPFLRNWAANAICDISILRRSILSHKNDLKALKLMFGDRQFSDTKIPFSCAAVDLLTGNIEVIDEGNLAEGILPSISIPGIFPPVEWEGRLLVDGSVLADVPVRELREQGADFVIGIKLGPKASPGYQTGFDVLNFIEMMKEDTLSRWEIEQADFSIDINIPDLNIMDFDSYEGAITRGYEITRQALPKLEMRLAQNHE